MYPLKDIIWDGEKFIIIEHLDSGDSLIISNDGNEWSVSNLESSSPAFFRTSKMVFNGKTYLVYDPINRNKILYSNDLKKWEHGNGTGIQANKIISSGSNFIALGDQGFLSTSNNSLEWSTMQVGVFGYFLDEASNNKIDVIVGDNDKIYFSNKDNIWTSEETGGYLNNFNSVAYGNKCFVVVGGWGAIFSHDGINWDYVSSDVDVYSSLNGVTWNGKVFVIVGDYGVIMESFDGKDWITCVSPAYTNINKVTYNGEAFIAVGDEGLIMKSEDGVAWSICESNTNSNLKDVVWTDRQFIAVGDAGIIQTSSNGIDWNTKPNKISINLQFCCMVRKICSYCW